MSRNSCTGVTLWKKLTNGIETQVHHRELVRCAQMYS